MTSGKFHTLSRPLTYHSYQRPIQGALRIGGKSLGFGWQMPNPPPPPSTQPLTWWTTPSISTGMMKSALFTGCKEERAAEAGARPAETALAGRGRLPQKPWGREPLGRAHLKGAVHQGLVQVDDHADLV